MVSALDSGSSSLGPSPDRDYESCISDPGERGAGGGGGGGRVLL